MSKLFRSQLSIYELYWLQIYLLFYKTVFGEKDNRLDNFIEQYSLFKNLKFIELKKKILGCIFTEKFENFDFESCNHIFTPEIESIMLASKVLKGIKKKKEVKNDLLSNMAPPIDKSCSTTKSFSELSFTCKVQ